MIPPDSPAIELVGHMESVFNLLTILISLAAVIYMRRIFKRTGGLSKQDKAWMWFLASVFSVLLLNLSTQVFILTGGRLAATMDPSSYETILSFVMTVSRTIMAVSMTVGAYILYNSMISEGDMQFSFKPVRPQPEALSAKEKVYDLKEGYAYLVRKSLEGDGQENTADPMDVFVDQVTHGCIGLLVTREYPSKVRKEHKLSTTPVVWLTYEREKSAVPPYDLESLNNVIRSFINNERQSVVLVNGMEYLILHNSFDIVLKFVQSIVDVVVQTNSRLLISIDALSINEQQYHQLRSEIDEFKEKSLKTSRAKD